MSNDPGNADRLAMIPYPAVQRLLAEARAAACAACARQLEEAASRWPDDPHVQTLLRAEAHDMRARGGLNQ